jgi:hypothetical protein
MILYVILIALIACGVARHRKRPLRAKVAAKLPHFCDIPTIHFGPLTAEGSQPTPRCGEVAEPILFASDWKHVTCHKCWIVEAMERRPHPQVEAGRLRPSLTTEALASRLVSRPWTPEEKAERDFIIRSLALMNGNQTRLAVRLGMSRRALISKLDCYEIPRPSRVHL